MLYNIVLVSAVHQRESTVGLPWWLNREEAACNAGNAGSSGLTLGQEDPQEEGMAAHSSVLAWEIPWTEEPDGRQSRGVTEGWT